MRHERTQGRQGSVLHYQSLNEQSLSSVTVNMEHKVKTKHPKNKGWPNWS